MVHSNTEDQEKDLVQCNLCANHVWLRRDRLEQHMRKVHPVNAPARKSFSSYHATLASTFPPRVAAQATPPTERFTEPGNIRLILRSGRRAGQGRCAECGLEELTLWHYADSNCGPVDICSSCKPKVFERSFGASNTEPSDTGGNG